jgi:threonine dehydrogenase-like Zn-dependent dehydrogenase
MTADLRTDALFLDRDLQVSIGIRDLAEPLADEAIVRVECAGVCGSDLHVLRTGDWVEDAQWPATLGHELCGTVELAPADGSLRVGDRVVADSRVPCDSCAECLAGQPERCRAVRFIGECRPGGFATRCVLPSRLLHRVPDGLAPETAVLAEPLAVVMHALSRLPGEPHSVAILGHGPIGALLHIEVRRRFATVAVTVAEPAALRAALARALGARTVPHADHLPDDTYDTVIDAAGYGGAFTDALRLLAPRGQLLLVALGHSPTTLTPAVLAESGATVVGAHAFVCELPEAIARLAEDPARYEPVVTDAVLLCELPSAVRAQLERPEAVKVVVCP